MAGRLLPGRLHHHGRRFVSGPPAQNNHQPQVVFLPKAMRPTLAKFFNAQGGVLAHFPRRHSRHFGFTWSGVTRGLHPSIKMETSVVRGLVRVVSDHLRLRRWRQLHGHAVADHCFTRDSHRRGHARWTAGERSDHHQVNQRNSTRRDNRSSRGASGEIRSIGYESLRNSHLHSFEDLAAEHVHAHSQCELRWPDGLHDLHAHSQSRSRALKNRLECSGPFTKRLIRYPAAPAPAASSTSSGSCGSSSSNLRECARNPH